MRRPTIQVRVDPELVTGVYKFFSKREYAELLIQRGAVHLGTLAYYRSLEHSAGARGDTEEGLQRLEVMSSTPETLTSENAPRHLKQAVASMGMPILSHGGTISVTDQSPDAYIYCMTLVDSVGVRADFGEFGIAISDPEALALQLTRRLRALRLVPDDKATLGCCRYSDKVTKLDSAFTEVDPSVHALEKPLGYSHQREVRAVWRATDPGALTIDVTCPELRSLCSRLY